MTAKRLKYPRDPVQLGKLIGDILTGRTEDSQAILAEAETGAAEFVRKHRIECNLDPKHVSTRYAERQNLNIRTGNRRMTRITNAFSKKAASHAHMMAIYFMHYNFVRIHQTSKITPAMAAGVTSKLWEMSDMAKVPENWELRNVEFEQARAMRD